MSIKRIVQLERLLNRLIIIAIALVFSPTSSLAASADLIRAITGDTIVAKVRNDEVTLKLADIDCPEPQQFGGEAAKAFTLKALSGKKFTYSTKGKDKYFRDLVIVTTSKGRNLNIALVQKGHAWASPESAPRIIKNEEKKAKTAKLGIWADAPQPPQAPVTEIKVQTQEIATTPKPKSTITKIDNKTKAAEILSDDLPLAIDNKIIDGCTGTWAINEKLVYYCIDQQIASKEVVMKLGPGETKDNCQKKWGDNYRKVQSCVEQHNAAENERKLLNEDSQETRECRQKWGNDIRLVNYCLENL